jgi:hypothetical protein
VQDYLTDPRSEKGGYDPDKLREKFAAMRKAGIHLQGKDSMVAVFEGVDPTRIVATLRYVYPDPDGMLPLERELHWKYPHPPPEARLYPYLHISPATRMMPEPLSLGTVLAGGAIEVKNLAVARGQKVDWVPILYYLGEMYGLSTEPANVPLQRQDERLRQGLERLESSSPVGARRVADAEASGIAHLYASEYAIQCAEPLVPYYRKMGFELIDVQLAGGSVKVMRIPRSRYVELGGLGFKGRPGWPEWNRAETDTSIKDPRYKGFLERIQEKLRAPGSCLRSVIRAI